MKFHLPLFLLFLSTQVFAATNAHYKLSDSAILEWGRNIELEANPLMMHRGVWFEGDWSGKAFSVWVSRVESKTSSFEDVKKEWQLLIDKSQREGKQFVDHGCIKKGKSTVICEKSETDISQKEKNMIENHILSRSIWHQGKELIYVRYHAYQNKALLKDLRGHINVVFGDF